MKFRLWVCHTDHRVWEGGDYNGQWKTITKGEESLVRPLYEENWTCYLCKGKPE